MPVYIVYAPRVKSRKTSRAVRPTGIINVEIGAHEPTAAHHSLPSRINMRLDANASITIARNVATSVGPCGRTQMMHLSSWVRHFFVPQHFQRQPGYYTPHGGWGQTFLQNLFAGFDVPPKHNFKLVDSL